MVILQCGVLLLLVKELYSKSTESILMKLDPENHYDYVIDDSGLTFYESLWATSADVLESSKYNPEMENVYYLFTRKNPLLPETLTPNGGSISNSSHFDGNKKTVFLIHGWHGTTGSESITVLKPAILWAEDVNVIVADWSKGAGGNYVTAVLNSVKAATHIASVIDWINQVTESNPGKMTIIGHSLGAHVSGMTARFASGEIYFVHALDPALPGWFTNPNRFKSDDAQYTEVMHTDGGVQGLLTDAGKIDFYPNGGLSMPGCSSSPSCNHRRCIYYLEESIITGGFLGSKCSNVFTAILGICFGSRNARMGGLSPKIGVSGIYYVTTNADPPYSRG